MDDAEPGRFVVLLPVAGKTAVPLHRVLAHTMWRRSPSAIIHYDAEQGSVLIQMVDAPTVAMAVICDRDDPSRDSQAARTTENGQFIGFDGTDPDSWPTMIRLLDFRAQRRAGGIFVALVRKLCGEHVWQAALAAAYDNGTTKTAEVPIGSEECSMLVDRWRNLIAPPQPTEMSHHELSRTISGWIAADPHSLGNPLTGYPGSHHNPSGSGPNGWGKREPR